MKQQNEEALLLPGSTLLPLLVRRTELPRPVERLTINIRDPCRDTRQRRLWPGALPSQASETESAFVKANDSPRQKRGSDFITGRRGGIAPSQHYALIANAMHY